MTDPAVLGALELLGINPADRDMVARMVIAYQACDGITNEELLRGRLVERFPELGPTAASNEAASTRIGQDEGPGDVQHDGPGASAPGPSGVGRQRE